MTASIPRRSFPNRRTKWRRAIKALIEALAKPERKLGLRIIDAQNSIIEQTSLDSFIAGFELAWRLSTELHNDESERSFFWRARRTGARLVSEEEPDCFI